MMYSFWVSQPLLLTLGWGHVLPGEQAARALQDAWQPPGLDSLEQWHRLPCPCPTVTSKTASRHCPIPSGGHMAPG